MTQHNQGIGAAATVAHKVRTSVKGAFLLLSLSLPLMLAAAAFLLKARLLFVNNEPEIDLEVIRAQ